jgi:hypothetical protein
MDNAVLLVQAYLQVNGYFTVAEYPVLEADTDGTARTLTDLDLLAFRFPGAGREVAASRARKVLGDVAYEPDPYLACPADCPDMIVGEVKRGRAQFNPATRDPLVLGAALARFGCCGRSEAEDAARRLLQAGSAQTACGHLVRMIAFGSVEQEHPARHWLVIPMDHVLRFLGAHLRERWSTLHHAQFSNPALDFLALIERARRVARSGGLRRDRASFIPATEPAAG